MKLSCSFRGFLALSGATFFVGAAAFAQTPALPSLEVTPTVLPGNGVVTLSLPAGVTLPAKRVKLAIYEWNRAQPAAEVWRVLEQRDGRWQTTVTVSADPGFYEFRLLTTDKVAQPLTADEANFQLTVPGIARVPGWWLPDGLPFAYLPKNGSTSNQDAPLFVTGLQRDFGRKTQNTPAANAFYGPTPAWRTLLLPSLREMVAPNYDWSALKSSLQQRLSEAQNRGERGFWGWSLTPGAGNTALLGASSAIAQLRGIINEVSPGAALIFDVDAQGDAAKVAQAARNVDAVAAFCDAVLLRVPDSDSALWALKTARRVVEEQPTYDLPVWVRVQSANGAPARETLLTYWMAGATGFIFDEAELSPTVRQFRDEVARDASLWIGAVTLEDAGILPPSDAPDAIDDENLVRFVKQLRGIGRVPLLARADIGKPETLMLRLGDRISAATADRLEKLVRAGADIYIEGTPTLDETGKAVPWRLSTLVGADITAIPAKRTNLILDEPWVFGAGRGARVPVEQNFSIKLQNPSMASQANVKKGVLTQVGPRTAATLEDGSPGLIINALGKGEVVWMPHRLIGNDAAILASPNGIPTATAPGNAAANAPRDATALQKYFNGVADYISPRLVQQRAVADGQPALSCSPVMLRRSSKGTLLLWIHRPSTNTTPQEIVAEGASEAALNLDDLTFTPTSTRGLQTSVAVTASGDTLLALAATKQALDAERNAPRAKAKLR